MYMQNILKRIDWYKTQFIVQIENSNNTTCIKTTYWAYSFYDQLNVDLIFHLKGYLFTLFESLIKCKKTLATRLLKASSVKINWIK